MFKNKGSKLEYNHIKVQQLKNNQFIITIPKYIAKHLNLVKGDVIEYRIRGENFISLNKFISDSD